MSNDIGDKEIKLSLCIFSLELWQS